MATLINYGAELIRINEKNSRIDYSKDGGKTWFSRFTFPGNDSFIDLLPYGNEILAVTEKGVKYSKDAGKSWFNKCLNGGNYGVFESLQDVGGELLAQTSKGLYYSKNEGRTWLKRN